MTDAAVAPKARFPLFSAMTPPAITAGPMTQTVTMALQTYMPYPDGEGDVIWQGTEFGMSAPAGSNITYAASTVTHRVSNPASFSSITAQIYAAGVPVGTPVAFTPSNTYITETVVTRAGFPPAGVASLAVQLTWHQTAMGMAYVNWASAQVAYSFADSIGIETIATQVAIGLPVITVTTPPVSLVSQGAAVTNLAPAFGQPTAAGNLLLGWVFSNSQSTGLDVTVSDPSWSLVQYMGGPFAWLSLWAKMVSSAGETAPSFSTSASTPMCQLLEFTGANATDRSGIGVEPADPRIVTATASGPDSRSGDLVFGICAWPGANPTPAAITMTGTGGDSTALTLSTVNNSATTNQIPWATGWAQAGAAAGPAGDAVTGTLSIFDFGEALIASFKTTLPETAPALELSGFGTFPPISAGNTITLVEAAVSQHASSPGMTAPAYQLWNGSTAQIGATQTGTVSTNPANIDLVTFAGATFAELPNLVLRIYAGQGAAGTGATQYVDAASLAVIYQ
jgi:hypothetical protein